MPSRIGTVDSAYAHEIRTVYVAVLPQEIGEHAEMRQNSGAIE
jgi:hypothetical protein